jgi:hypothetical protein
MRTSSRRRGGRTTMTATPRTAKARKAQAQRILKLYELTNRKGHQTVYHETLNCKNMIATCIGLVNCYRNRSLES